MFMTGIVGRLFREFAITLSLAVAGLGHGLAHADADDVPRLLEPEKDEKHGRLLSLDRADLQRDARRLRPRAAMGAATPAPDVGRGDRDLGGTIWLEVIVPKGFLPQQDTGLIVGVTEAAQTISFKAMVERQRVIAEMVRQDPDVDSVASFIGAGTVNATMNTGRLYIDLKPREDRQRQRRRGHRAAARGDRGGRGDLAVHAGGAGSPDRQPPQPNPVPIHAGRCRRRRASRGRPALLEKLRT